jgi:hypothetical protein
MEEDDEYPDWIDEEIARMVDLQIMWPDSMGPNGEFRYKFDLEKLEVESPLLYEWHMARTEEALLKLVNLGLADAVFDDDLNVMFKLHEGVDINDIPSVE